jgi:F-type H+-transporting ATPase subunit gamma
VAQNVRAILHRIDNIQDIRQITRAMNAIAMTKVTRLKRRLEATAPMLDELRAILGDLAAHPAVVAHPHPLMRDNGAQRPAVLVLNADRGLCGRFRGELNRRGEQLLEEEGPAAELLVGGEKARVHFSRQGVEILKAYTRSYDQPTMAIARTIAEDLIALYRQGMIGRCRMVVMRFRSDLVQRLETAKLLPIEIEARGTEELLEPNAVELLDVALPVYLQGILFEALLHTRASEEAIRRQAMKDATDNADELIGNLQRSYYKARQQGITREIADIMGGAEALRER